MIDDNVPTDVKEVSKVGAMDNVASPSEATDVSTEEELQSALQKSGRIILKGDIQVTEPLSVTAGAKIAIDGADHRIYSGENPNLWGIMRVYENAEVSLQNITIDATGMDCGEKLDDGRYRDYYAIFTKGGSKLTINDGTNIICNDREEGIDMKNQEKGGIFLKGMGIMTGGEISGFYGGAISVMDEFILKDGLLSGISEGGGSINNSGTTTIKGGTISGSDVGILNSGVLVMEDGVIKENQDGIVTNNRDNQTDELYYPVATLIGGSITDNERYAIYNKKRGELIINGAHISGAVMSEMRLFGKSQKSGSKVVIRNENNSTVKLISGKVVSNAANEVAIWNDKTSTIKMTGGVISVNGAQSVAIQNDNSKTDAVVLQDALLDIGADSNVVSGSGNTSVGGGFKVNAGDRATVQGRSDQNGWVTPTLTVAKIGDIVDFTIQANSGYQVSGVTVNGKSVGAVFQYKLAVTGADVLEAQFVQVSSSGGSGGGSSKPAFGNSAAKPEIPETPGAWVQDQTGWKFTAPNQTLYTNSWVRSKNHWYWVGADSYMKTGWNQIAEKWYYLTPVSGEMKTRWLQDGDSWYYLDETGVRKTGWIQDGTKWYYLNQDGKVEANTTTPDGYNVDGSGAWVQ